MRFRIFLFALTLVMANFSAAQAAPVRKIVPQGAVSFTSKANGFAVWLPGKLVQVASWTFSDGRPSTRSYGLKWPKSSRHIVPDAVRFVIDAAPISNNKPFSRPAARTRLKEMTDLYVVTHKVKSAFTSEMIEQAGFPGRDLRFLSRLNGQSERIRLYQSGKWMYTLSIYGTADAMKKHSGVVNRVVDSFRILPQ